MEYRSSETKIRHYSIRLKVGLILVIATTLLLLAFGVFDYVNTRARLEADLNTFADNAIQRLALNSAAPLWDVALEQADEVILSEMMDRRIYAVLVQDEYQSVFRGKRRNAAWDIVEWRESETLKGDYLPREKPISREIKDAPMVIGRVTIYVSRHFMNQELTSDLYGIILRAIILNVMLLAVLLVSMNRILIQPIRYVADGLKQITGHGGDLKGRLEVTGRDEIGELALQFNSFLESEKKYSALFDYLHLAIDREDYSSMPADEQGDDLVKALNRILDTLARSDRETKKQDWLKTGQTMLNEQTSGERSIQEICRNAVTHLAQYLDAQVGAVYVRDAEDPECFGFTAGYAVDRQHVVRDFRLGQGLIGQAAESMERILLTAVPDDYLLIQSGLGGMPPKNILILPLVFEHQTVGLLELGAIRPFDEAVLDYADKVSTGIAIALNSARFREQLKALLEKTQIQARELQAQQDELQQANIQLEEQKRAAYAAAKAKADFLANMSHEIRTPMNGVIAAADLALGEEMSPNLQKYLKIIHSSGYSLLGIINDILDFSKIDAGKLELEQEPFRLDELLERITDLFVSKTVDKGIELLVDLDPQVPKALIGDALRLQQIFTNLLGNAIKFTDKGGSVTVGAALFSPEAGVQAEADQARVRFFVKDTGMGMKSDYLARLFEPFSQADASTTRKFGGTGLGLTISKRLVELMGGEIWVESEYGCGTIFSFAVNFNCQSELLPGRLLAPADLQGKRALIVDDSAESRDILGKILASFGFQVSAVSSGVKALDEIKQQSAGSATFGLLITDWMMPGMDGITLARRVKEILNPPPPIIMLTSFGREQEKHDAEAAGASAFLTKPINASALFDTIMDVFGKTEAKLGGRAEPITTRASMYMKRIKGGRILVADDNTTNQDIALAVLEKAEVVVEVVYNGREAVEAVKARPYDAVLMDMQMPVMDGYQATREIRAWESGQGQELGIRNQELGEGQGLDQAHNPSISNSRFAIPTHIPIIAMTAHAIKGDEEKCLKAGMDDYVTKPINQDLLYRVLAKHMSPRYDNDSVEPEPSGTPAPPMPQTALGNDNGDRPLPKKVPGIDIHGTLEKLKIDPKVYVRILFRFLEKNITIKDQLDGAHAAQDTKTLQGLAHLVKGSGGNIGALELREIAGELEQACQDASDWDRVTDLTHQTLTAMEQVLDGIRSLRSSS